MTPPPSPPLSPLPSPCAAAVAAAPAPATPSSRRLVRLPEGRAGALTASRSRFCRAEVRGTAAAAAVPAVLTESRRGGLNCAATERRTALLRFTPKLNVGTGRLGDSLSSLIGYSCSISVTGVRRSNQSEYSRIREFYETQIAS